MLSFPSRIKTKQFLLVIVILILVRTPIQAQTTQPDTLQNITIVDSADTVKQTLWPSLIASAIVPGLGQIRQENPGRAVIFYWTSLALLFNTVHNYRNYKNYGDQDARNDAYRSLALFSQVYLINLLDVLDTYLKDKYEPWPQDLYSDIPMKSPWGSVARSAMIPGWGQVYNEQYIKAAVSIGAFCYFASQIYNYNQKYQETGDQYYWDKRVVNSWYLGLTYVLVLLDAYVDAALFQFDEAMDITINMVPENKNLTLNMGIKIAF